MQEKILLVINYEKKKMMKVNFENDESELFLLIIWDKKI
jgi:hypothetical protein